MSLVRFFKKDLANIYSPFMVLCGVAYLIENGFEIELGEGGKRIDKLP
jgi:hypothetical protein